MNRIMRQAYFLAPDIVCKHKQNACQRWMCWFDFHLSLIIDGRGRKGGDFFPSLSNMMFNYKVTSDGQVLLFYCYYIVFVFVGFCLCCLVRICRQILNLSVVFTWTWSMKFSNRIKTKGLLQKRQNLSHKVKSTICDYLTFHLHKYIVCFVTWQHHN